MQYAVLVGIATLVFALVVGVRRLRAYRVQKTVEKMIRGMAYKG
jgi:uncharacterized membrane protein YhaH (DUF805 family)